MTIIFQDSFDHYGDGDFGLDRMLDGVWAAISTGVNLEPHPTVGARTGQYALHMLRAPATDGARLALPSNHDELFVHFGLAMENLPDADNLYNITSFRTAANGLIANVWVGSNGRIYVTNSVGTTIADSSSPVVSTGAWNHVAIRFKIGAGTGLVEVRVNKIEVLNEDSLSLGSTNIGQLGFDGSGSPIADGFYIDDLVVNTATGTYNNTWLGDPRVATLYPRADDPVEQGWTPQPRWKFGNGVLELDGNGDGVTAADSSDFEFGSGDFTLECFVKFRSLPTGSNRATFFGKWRETTNERSYELFLGGPSLNNNQLAFRISTDGQAGTVATIVTVEWEPALGHYYHVAVQREAGEVTLFIDGVAQNAPAADANSYHDNASLFSVGGQQSSTNSMVANTSVDGFLEEVRVTKGVARYNPVGFVPPSAAFDRGVGDPDWSSVVLLAGFDSGITDESSFGRALTARGSAARLAVDDAQPGDYKTINQSSPRDDTFMEAPYIAASGVLTLTANPADTETVTVDGNTYTFNTVLGGAGSVLIGADADESLDNLAAAINNDVGEGTVYGTGTAFSANASAYPLGNGQMRVEADTAGTAGNAIGTTETLANGTWTAATLTGGTNIPGPSAFLLDRLPAKTTGVRAVTIVTRSRKTDTGDCNVQAALVTADDSSANGADRPVTTAFTYYGDIIEQDPSTLGALTPSTFVGARVRIDRTL